MASAAEQAAAIGEGQPMPGEGGDRKYVVDGKAWRVRVRMTDAKGPVAPVNGAPELAPVSYGVGVSVALLDGKGAVAKDETGALLVFDQHVVTIDADALGRPGFDPAAALNAAIAGEIAAAASIIAKKEQLAAALAGWSAPAESESISTRARPSAASSNEKSDSQCPPQEP